MVNKKPRIDQKDGPNDPIAQDEDNTADLVGRACEERFLRLDEKAYEILEEKIHPTEDRKKETHARKVLDEVFDHPTLLTIYKLICNDKLKTIDFPISTGKEGNVFKGTGPDGDVAVKIYRISNLNFNSISKYILGDHRFRGIERNRRKLMHQWTQKEFRNLERMNSAGVCVPAPFAYENNVLIMEYIGNDEGPAPVLRNYPPEDGSEATSACDFILSNVRVSLQKARIIHGDLSEYNILRAQDGLVIIDVSQGVPARHPMAPELLKRDVHNIVKYFNRLGAEADPETEYYKILARDVTFASKHDKIDGGSTEENNDAAVDDE